MSDDKNSNVKNWARELSKGLIRLDQLSAHGWIQPEQQNALEMVQQNFDIRIPVQMAEAIRQGDVTIQRQIVPTADELSFFPEELEDPIGDEAFTPVDGIVHRYPNRVLLKPTHQCALYCRFCFRRYKVSQSKYNLTSEQMQGALSYIQQHSEIWEVILSGGDPLTLTDARLEAVLQPLMRIEHVKIIRIHTRIFTALPSRITNEILKLFKNTKKRVWFVAHINSATELDSFLVRESIQMVLDAGFGVLSQSVLLKGVNDSHQALSNLLCGLIEAGVKPYYLHYPDLSQGTHHFRIPLQRAMDIVEGLRSHLSGTCLPQLIVDIPGGWGKVPAYSPWVEHLGNDTWTFLSPISKKRITISYPHGF